MTVLYPFLPEGRFFLYVPENNSFMRAAREYALSHSLDDSVKTGSVLVKDGRIIGAGANGSEYHNVHGCERARRGIRTGEGYEQCEGCHPKNHSEPRAIADAKNHEFDTSGSDLYLWGHWWACEPCWNAIQEANVASVYLLDGSERLFNKSDASNILGQW